MPVGVNQWFARNPGFSNQDEKIPYPRQEQGQGSRDAGGGKENCRPAP
jgi:hypothetical protein